jgi:hypothetical protein
VKEKMKGKTKKTIAINFVVCYHTMIEELTLVKKLGFSSKAKLMLSKNSSGTCCQNNTRKKVIG